VPSGLLRRNIVPYLRLSLWTTLPLIRTVVPKSTPTFLSSCFLLCPGWSHWGFRSARADSQGGTPGSCLAPYFASTPSVNDRSTLASTFCFWSVSAWLLVLGVRARRSGTSQVESVGLSWTLPHETVPIHRSPFWLCYIWGSGTTLRDLASRICRALPRP